MPDDAFAPFDLKAIIQVLLRQKRIISYSAALTFIAAALYLGFATPKFTATALLLVEPNRTQLLETKSQFAPSGSVENARVDSEVEILRSDALMMGVINKWP